MTRGSGGKGGNRGKGTGKAPSRNVMISKRLSFLLRHGAKREGLKVGDGGYAALDDVLRNNHIAKLQTNLTEIKEIVVSDEKQRFNLIHVPSSDNTSSQTPTTAPETTTSPSHNPTEEDSLPPPQPHPPSSPTQPASTPPKTTTANTSNDTALTSKDPNSQNYLIRANQGHSFKVSDEGLHAPITLQAGNLPDFVVHGTRKEVWPKILASGGLKPMRRRHVHFATGVPEPVSRVVGDVDVLAEGLGRLGSKDGDGNGGGTEGPKVEDAGEHAAAGANDGEEVAALRDDKDSPLVLSGMRNTSTLLIFLDLKKALKRGGGGVGEGEVVVKFWMSANGVVLSEGNEEGIVPMEFFSKVVEKGGAVLVRDGKVVK
ncbi:MAG: hypothetical protein M1831_000132 [Alyxoria varia]|nr:MAG: hypothetical protein M1831_000132 [Alyxoria varia]